MAKTNGRGGGARLRPAGPLVGTALLLAASAAALPMPPPSIPLGGPRGPDAGGAAAEAETLLARADRALAAGQPDLALGIYGDVPDGPGLAARVSYGRARCWLALGRVERATKALKAAVAAADSLAGGNELAAAGRELLGQVYLRAGRPELARGVFEEIARGWPDRRDWAAVMVGRAFESEAAYRSALAAIRPVLRGGRSDPAYDLARAIYWKLDDRGRRELDGLLTGYLRATAR